MYEQSFPEMRESREIKLINNLVDNDGVEVR